MAGRKDIAKDGEKTRFSSTNQPKIQGNIKRTPSRHTLFKKYANLEYDLHNPLTKKKEKTKVIDQVAIVAYAKAISGDDAARKDVLNNLFGKQADRIISENTNIDVDYSKLTNEEAEDLFNKDISDVE